MQTVKIMMISLLLLYITACSKQEEVEPGQESIQEKKIGVLIVSHGSHSEQWREMLEAVGDSVKPDVLNNKSISAVKSAFMEYTEPSIASRMKEFDKEGYTDVIVVPMLLTVSGHSFDDIPHILGVKNTQTELEKLQAENIEVYRAKANVHITPLLDFPKILGDNLVRRIKELSQNPENEACVLVAYGDGHYNTEWTALLNNMIEEIKNETHISHCEFSWCGHIVGYKSEPTTEAINKALGQREKTLVIPVLVAVDEMFQGKIIGSAIENSANKENVVYKPDSILPDENIEQWIVDISNEFTDKINSNK